MERRIAYSRGKEGFGVPLDGNDTTSRFLTLERRRMSIIRLMLDDIREMDAHIVMSNDFGETWAVIRDEAVSEMVRRMERYTDDGCRWQDEQHRHRQQFGLIFSEQDDYDAMLRRYGDHGYADCCPNT